MGSCKSRSPAAPSDSEQTGIHFVYASRRQQPKAARAFMDFAEQKMRDHGWSRWIPWPEAAAGST